MSVFLIPFILIGPGVHFGSPLNIILAVADGAVTSSEKTVRMSPSFCRQEPLPDDEAEQRELYEVYALVYIVEQPDVGRHLVSCIKVSEPYHQRKERVTCTQWYLFNDFCIEPIEKVHKQVCDEKSNVTVEPLFQSHPKKLGKGGHSRRVGGGGGRGS